MRIDIITVLPELLESPLNNSIVERAKKKGIVEIHVHHLRKYGKGPRQQVDDYSYGGDAGMVLMVEPVYMMIRELKAEVERLRLAESLSGNTSDSTKSRARINRLLREVDKCIALLTNVQQS